MRVEARKKEFFDREYSAKEAYARLWRYASKYKVRLVVGIVCCCNPAIQHSKRLCSKRVGANFVKYRNENLVALPENVSKFHGHIIDFL